MKHRILPALAATLVLSLSACGQDTSPRSTASESPSPTPSDPSTSTSPEPTTSESPSDSAAPAPDVKPITVSVKGLATGSAPALDYLRHTADGWELVRVDGDTLPGYGGYYDFATIEGSGFVGLRIGDDPVVDVVDGAGRITHSEKALGYRLSVTSDGEMIGWLRPGGVPVDYEVATDEVLTGPKVAQGTALAALAGEKTCREATSPVHGCLWLVTDNDSGQTWGASSHGIVDTVPGLRTATDIDDDGYMVGLSSVSDDGSCSVLLRTWRKPTWETCDYRLREFSPAGTRISATNAYADGLGDTQLAVLDREGRVQQEFRAARDVTFMTARWEDEDHLLVLTYARNGWSILRLGVDGSTEVAVPAIAGDDTQARLVLPTR